ncbi:uncharacterized protein STAUR_1459 [Stigmatella aurantiaca DW4/3-1]|uniref:Uncharacterized protein n=1 Tax=Stigmatella aurantiaca (strain DW4/3-1) TaxID=378806 RepID=E3FKU5_STIAD|nr:uncharacterized protein STAUR_1459 [Stigmatella aurantiaca DW4/3-1]
MLQPEAGRGDERRPGCHLDDNLSARPVVVAQPGGHTSACLQAPEQLEAVAQAPAWERLSRDGAGLWKALCHSMPHPPAALLCQAAIKVSLVPG